METSTPVVLVARPQKISADSASLENPRNPTKRTMILRLFAVFVVSLGLISATLIGYAMQIPVNFPVQQLVDIPSGSSARQVAELFQEKGLVRSSVFFRIVLRWNKSDTGLHAGSYVFKEPLDMTQLSQRIRRGEFGIQEIKVTIPEGISVRDVSEIIAKGFPNITQKDFVSLALPFEGYLFPDTYAFYATASTTEMITKMRANYELRVSSLRPAIAKSGHSEQEIIAMASLLEGEARTTESRKLVSGILWARIQKNMPLQVDAVFPYILGTSTPHVTYDHLAIDSPYNTYRNKGLPPGPINNPGLDAISAALNPTMTDFLFYLTDSDGLMHYAKNFEEHKVNKQKYLR